MLDKKTEITEKLKESGQLVTELSNNKDFDAIKNTLDAKNKEIADKIKADKSFDELEVIFNDLDDSIDKTKLEKAKLETGNNAIKELIKAKVDEIKDFITKMPSISDYDVIKSALNPLSAEYDKIKNDVSKNKQQLTEFLEQISTKLDKANEDKKVKDAEFVAKKASLSEKINEAKTFIDLLPENKDYTELKLTLQTSLDKANQDNGKENNSLAKLEEITNSLNSKLTEAKTSKEAKDELIKAEKDKISNKVSELDQFIQGLGEDEKYSELKTSLNEIKVISLNNSTDKTKTSEDLKAVLSKLQLDIEKATESRKVIDKKTELEAEIVKATELAKTLEENLDFAEAKKELNNKLKETNIAKDIENITSAKLEELITNLKSTFVSATAKKEAAETKLAQTKAKITEELGKVEQTLAGMPNVSDYETIKTSLEALKTEWNSIKDVKSKTNEELTTFANKLNEKHQEAKTNKNNTDKQLANKKKEVEEKIQEITSYLSELSKNADYTEFKSILESAKNKASTDKDVLTNSISDLANILSTITSALETAKEKQKEKIN
ncbi:hypothetical protein [Mycoplasmopsis alligatoris]|uniref:Uncharacterized protein n=1 Tax=Mycoplasmopsis alligatoris A21JP2 TaxID=747682 RepID=D4XWJ8_9BACT|nr:hypothetical protein [Mycoplasmopsis alligatoris]EFF41169.1 hypothetical protein MALL_0432 [Mycoplasmopsis alligatoris A21JP2]